MRPFKITAHSGQYKIWMRARYDYIRSKRALRKTIQENINAYSKKLRWENYAISLQQKFDENKIHDIASLWGIFNKSVRIGD